MLGPQHPNWIVLHRGSLICTHCGATKKVFPMSVRELAGLEQLTADFSKEHKGCPLMPESPAARCVDCPESWILGFDTGQSSMAIWSVLAGPEDRTAAAVAVLDSFSGVLGTTPSDSGDFARCMRLLDAIPAWRGRLEEVARAFPEWKPLVAQWDRLESLYRQKKSEELFDMLRELRSVSTTGCGCSPTARSGPQ